MMPRRYRGARIGDLLALLPWAIITGLAAVGVLALLERCGG